MGLKARATEQRRIDAIWRAAAKIIGEAEASRIMTEIEARRDEVDWELARRIRAESCESLDRRRQERQKAPST